IPTKLCPGLLFPRISTSIVPDANETPSNQTSPLPSLSSSDTPDRLPSFREDIDLLTTEQLSPVLSFSRFTVWLNDDQDAARNNTRRKGIFILNNDWFRYPIQCWCHLYCRPKRLYCNDLNDVSGHQRPTLDSGQ